MHRRVCGMDMHMGMWVEGCGCEIEYVKGHRRVWEMGSDIM